MTSSRLIAIGVVCAVLATARCRGQAKSPVSRNDGWVRLFARGGITAFVDTARVEEQGSTLRVWLRFDYDQPMPKMESTTGPYVRNDAQEDIDCAGRKARDVELRLLDSTGAVVGDTLWGPSNWLPFASHPLGAHVLEPACEQLGKRGRAA